MSSVIDESPLQPLHDEDNVNVANEESNHTATTSSTIRVPNDNDSRNISTDNDATSISINHSSMDTSIEKGERGQNEHNATDPVLMTDTIEEIDSEELNEIPEPVTSIFINSTTVPSPIMNEVINNNGSSSNRSSNDNSWMSLERNQSQYNGQLPRRRHSIATATVTIATTPVSTEYTAPLANTSTALEEHPMVNESIAEQQPQQQQRQHISSSPLSSPLQRSPSVIPPAAVRQHNITYAWNLATRLFIVNGPFLIIYLIWSVCQLAACIIVLFITSLQHCDRPLRIFLILQLIRILIAVPLFLLIQRLRRNSLNGLEFINYDWIARINSLIDFFVLIVFVAGNYMVFTSETCQSTAPVLFYLSVAFLIIGYITLMFPVIFCLSTFFCLTCTLVVLHWIGVGKNDGAGATDEEIDNLSVLYYQPWTMDIMNNSNSNDNTVTLEENEETVGNRASIDLHTVIVDQPSDIGNTTNNTMEHRIDDDIVATVIPNNTNDNEDNALGGWLSSTMLLPRDTAAAAMTLRKTASASVSSIKQDTATVSSSTMARMESGRGFRAWFKRFKLPSSSSSSSSRQRRQRRRRQFNLLWPFHYRRWRRGTTTTTQPSSTAIPLVKLPSSIPKHNQVDGEHAICAICLCDYEWNEPIRRLHCQHHFHRDCVDPWFRVNRHCPVCKRALTWKRQQQLSSTTARWRARLSMRRGRRQQQQQQRRNSHHRQHQRSLSASVALTLQPSTMAS